MHLCINNNIALITHVNVIMAPLLFLLRRSSSGRDHSRFYGNVIIFCGLCGLIATGPGQTATIGTSISSVVDDYKLPRTTVSLFYLGATLCSACTLPLIGKILDRVGPRKMYILFSLCLGGAAFLYSVSKHQWQLFFGFYLLRVCGQGGLWLTATNLINIWFVERRGRVMGLISMVVSFVLTGIFSSLSRRGVEEIGWRKTFQLLAGLEWFVIAPIGILLVGDRPEKYGMLPDGKGYAKLEQVQDGIQSPTHVSQGSSNVMSPGVVSPTATQSTMSPSPSKVGKKMETPTRERETDEKHVGKNLNSKQTITGNGKEEDQDATLNEALRSKSFWFFAHCQMANAALVTAVFFHMDSLFSHFSDDLTILYLSSAVSGGVAAFFSGYAIDGKKIRYENVATLVMFFLTVLYALTGFILWQWRGCVRSLSYSDSQNANGVRGDINLNPSSIQDVFFSVAVPPPRNVVTIPDNAMSKSPTRIRKPDVTATFMPNGGVHIGDILSRPDSSSPSSPGVSPSSSQSAITNSASVSQSASPSSCESLFPSSAAFKMCFLGLILGSSGGAQTVVNNAVFAAKFGRTHNGQIQGVANCLMVFGSAVGPALMSYLRDHFGNYWETTSWLGGWSAILFLIGMGM